MCENGPLPLRSSEVRSTHRHWRRADVWPGEKRANDWSISPHSAPSREVDSLLSALSSDTGSCYSNSSCAALKNRQALHKLRSLWSDAALVFGNYAWALYISLTKKITDPETDTWVGHPLLEIALLPISASNMPADLKDRQDGKPERSKF